MIKLRFPSIFRIFYSTTYTTLFLIILVLLAITPADHITQTLRNNNLGNIFAVGAVYVVTALIALFILASRLYNNRVALASIPKFYLPIEEGEVSKNVRRAIVKNLQRSAIIAWDSRPRDVRPEAELDDTGQFRVVTGPHGTTYTKLKEPNLHGETLIPVNIDDPPWGSIEHLGWSSPASVDLPELQFETVLAELPNLIEAKAVTLAPPDPSFNFMREISNEYPPPPDPNIVALLQRPSNIGMRDYLSRLNSLEVIDPPNLVTKFLSHYEPARFSTQPLSESKFRDLMTAFADLLLGMVPVDADTLSETQLSGLRSQSSQSSIVRTSGAANDDADVFHSSPAASMRSSDSVIHTKPTRQR